MFENEFPSVSTIVWKFTNVAEGNQGGEVSGEVSEVLDFVVMTRVL